MECTVTYTDGRRRETFPSIQTAVCAFLADYPEGVVIDAGGYDHGAASDDEAYDIRTGRVALLWACEDDATGDDGTRSVAEIVIET